MFYLCYEKLEETQKQHFYKFFKDFFFPPEGSFEAQITSTVLF